MILSLEQKEKLKQLFLDGVITAKEYEAKISPIMVVGFLVKFKDYIIAAWSYLSLINWKEDIKYFKSKKVLIYIFIAALIYSVAYFHGKLNKPVHVNFGGSEFKLVINPDEVLHVQKDGTVILEDSKGNKLHTIKVNDIPSLKKALMPFGVEFKPFVTVGGSIGVEKQVQPEAGVGVDLFKIYKANLAAWATQYGIYVGADYYITTNSGIIAGIGHGYQNADIRTYVGWKWNF